MPISQTPAAAAATGENNEEEKSMAICRNYGCGKRFRLNAPDDDKDDAQRRNADECRYHSGDQNFVDGLKWWSCCGDKIKVTDFNAFLNIPGCTTGYHSNEKRISKSCELDDEEDSDNDQKEPINLNEILSEFVEINVSVDEKLRDKRLKDLNNLKEQFEKESKEEFCSNNGCGLPKNADNSAKPCIHHPGESVFHETYKFWSCCEKRTIKYEDFQNQPGCSSGDHKFESKAQKLLSRPTEFDIDPIVTGKYIEILIYSSLIDPDSIRISSNNQILKIKFNHYDRSGNKLSADEEVKLAKLCDSSRSEASLSRMKLEIKMAI